MDRLWTPWRMAYIKGDERSPGCIFCDLPAKDAGRDEASLILARGERAFVLMNKFPYNSGHVLIAPYAHTPDFTALTPADHAEMAEWSARCFTALGELYAPEGFNVGMNLGRAGGAGIVEHLHGHIVPRWSGDTNYMTTVGGTKVLPETLEQTYARLRPLLSGD
jgi:ATP adenylyltransferase